MSCISSRTAGGVPVAREIHQARDEVGELVGAHEQQRPAPRTEIDHRHRHVQQLLGGKREELRTRDGLDDVQQHLAGMTGVTVGHRERVVHAP